ncbi:hypothetical protein CEXT_237191 [Caerostris extrusa]|uniref:Uncharacterized protein n=1 Tax=Caerostris extrusa TaxID=172846 RepID=A0AAV4U139_CAEEX|nr:hypothetical protein CEXT_237191 [Caerostris extrusa]
MMRIEVFVYNSSTDNLGFDIKLKFSLIDSDIETPSKRLTCPIVRTTLVNRSAKQKEKHGGTNMRKVGKKMAVKS